MRTALVTLILVQGLTLPLAQAQRIEVRGFASCGTWVSDRLADPLSLRSQHGRSWLIGYLSGMAMGLNLNFWGRQGVNSLDNQSIYLWVDNYCRANPLKDLDDAGNALLVERCPTAQSCP
jgi:hypothetical protein